MGKKIKRPRFNYTCTGCEVPLTREERRFPDQRNLVGSPVYCEICVSSVEAVPVRWMSGSGDHPPKPVER